VPLDTTDPLTRGALWVAGGLGIVSLAALAWPPKPNAFGDEVLRQARLDLGVSESNNPQRVAAMLAVFGLPATDEWCAAATSAWIRQAASALRVKAPVTGSAGAKALGKQFEAVGLWLGPADLDGRVKPGMVPVWQRGPVGFWTGHVGVVATVSGGSFTAIEGNAQGQAVVENRHDISDASLLGIGRWS
jgi:hypothetical protein